MRLGSFTTGSGPADTVVPQVVLVSPVDTSTAVPINGQVVVQFSKPVAAPSVYAQTVIVSAGGVPIVGTMTLEQNNRVLRWKVANLFQFAPNTLHTATVTTGVTDTAGNPLAVPFTSTFTTGAGQDTTAPTVVSVMPATGATNVSRATAMTVTFSEPIDPATVTLLDPVLSGGANGTFSLTTFSSGFGSFVPGTVVVSADRTTITFTPAVPLFANQSYGLSVNGIEDASGNRSSFTSSVTTTVAAGTNVNALPASAAVTATPSQLFADGFTTATVTITNIARAGILVPNGTVIAVSADPSLFETGAGGTIIGGVPSSQDPRFQLFTTLNGSVTLTYQSPNRPDLFNGGTGIVWAASVDAAGALSAPLAVNTSRSVEAPLGPLMPIRPPCSPTAQASPMSRSA